MLEQLFRIDSAHRDDDWRRNFYSAMLHSTLAQRQPPVQNGPDRFPYLQLELPDVHRPTAPVTVTGLLESALDEGYGMTIYDGPASSTPQWVFTYGDLVAQSLYGNFDGDLPEPPIASSGPRKVMIAAPSESFLPARTRRVLGKFMHDVYRVPQPKVCLVIDPQSRPGRSIMVNLKVADYQGDREKLDRAMHYLTWFIPRTQGLLSEPPNWDQSQFVAL